MSDAQRRDELIARLQLAYALARDGHQERVQAILTQCTAAAADTLTQADVALYQGLISQEWGNLEAAAAFLSQAQKGYEAANDPYQAGVAASYCGRLAAESGLAEKSLACHYAAFQNFLEAADLMGIGNELARMGLVMRQMHRHREALDCFRQALEAHQATAHWRSVLTDHFNLASTAQDLGLRPLAQEHAKAARTLADQLNDSLSLAQTEYLLAGLAADTGEHAQALAHYAQAQRQAEALGETKLLADVMLGIGITRYALGELAIAGERLAEALTQYMQLGDAEGVGVSLSNLGLVHLANGNLAKAEQCFVRAIDIQQRRGNHLAAARQQGHLGLILRAQGKLAEAEQIHHQALQTAAAAGDLSGEATQRLNLGSLAYLNGRFSEAEQEYRAALALYEAADNRQGQADIQANLGNIAHAQSQWERALNHYQKALTQYRQLGHRRGAAGVMGNKGVIYRELGDWTKAIEQHEQAITLYQETADRPGEAATLNNLALALRLVGNTAGALAALDRAQRLYEEVGDRRGQAAILDNVGLLHREAGMAATAMPYHRQALTIYHALDVRAGMMTSLGNLAQSEAAQGNILAANDYYEQALTLARTLNDGDAQARLLVGRGDLHRHQQEWDTAYADYEAALALIEEQRLRLAISTHRETFLGWERQSVYRRLVKLLTRQGAGKRAWQICEQSRGRTFLDQLGRRTLPPPGNVDADWWDDFQSTRNQLAVLADEGYFGEGSTYLSSYQRQLLLRDAQERLDTIAANAPDSVKQWVELWQGRPVLYDMLRQNLLLK